ncbi:MAG: flagellar assembly regulator FliX [Rickettsiales bacterium]|jgi:hypothetical protein|nr:flagellar assembly regulator FliX [Rickettsiales bacterium]
MRIIGPGGVNQPSSVKKKKKISDSEDFDSFLSSAGDVDDAVSVSQSSSISAMDSLLSLQEVGTPPSLTEAATERGQQLIDYLDDIRHGLLTGGLQEERIRSLSTLIEKSRPDVVDPGLNQILDEIEIRAAVELAKLKRGKK